MLSDYSLNCHKGRSSVMLMLSFNVAALCVGLKKDGNKDFTYFLHNIC